MVRTLRCTTTAPYRAPSEPGAVHTSQSTTYRLTLTRLLYLTRMCTASLRREPQLTLPVRRTTEAIGEHLYDTVAIPGTRDVTAGRREGARGGRNGAANTRDLRVNTTALVK